MSIAWQSGVRASPETLAGEDVRALLVAADRLARLGLARADLGETLAELCRTLQGMGVHLRRVHAAAAVLHPLYTAEGHTWVAGANAVPLERHTREDESGEAWLRSPFRHMLETQQDRLRCPLTGGGPLPFPVLEEMRAAGGTDYFACGIAFGPEAETDGGMIASWLTDRPGGFAGRDLALIETLLPHFAAAVAHVNTRGLAGTLLETYVGVAAGRRVLHGAIARGTLSSLSAAILFADLRGFSALADRLEGEPLVELLNGYLERMAEPVAQHGGEVLKFMGDGMLGAFAMEGAEPAEVCRRALAAAVEAHRRVGAWNAERQAAGLPVLELDMALHLGEVLFGNVGAPGRLDFTMIGPAINEAARMEALCRMLGRNLLISESFHGAAGAPEGLLVALGRHRLAGLPAERPIFGLADAETVR